MNEGVRTLDRRSHNPELYQLSYAHHRKDIYKRYQFVSTFKHNFLLKIQRSRMVRPAGLEPATLGLEGRCSIQMSYGRRIYCYIKAISFNVSLIEKSLIGNDILT